MAFDEWDNNAKSIKKETKAYLDSTVEYYKLWGFKVVSKSAAALIKFSVVLFFLFMLVFFVSIAGAIALSQLLESYIFGFLIVGGIYLIFTVLVLLFSDKVLEKKLLRKFSSIFFEK